MSIVSAMSVLSVWMRNMHNLVRLRAHFFKVRFGGAALRRQFPQRAADLGQNLSSAEFETARALPFSGALAHA